MTLVDKLNNAMDDPESKMLSSKYYEPNKIASLFKNTNKHFSFFHFHFSLKNSQHLSLNTI